MKKNFVFILFVLVLGGVLSAGCIAPPMGPAPRPTNNYHTTDEYTETTQTEYSHQTHSTIYSTKTITTYETFSFPTYFHTYTGEITYTDPIIENTSIQTITAEVDDSFARYTLFRWLCDGCHTTKLVGSFSPSNGRVYEFWTDETGNSSSSYWEAAVVPFTIQFSVKDIVNTDPMIVSVSVPFGLYYPFTDSEKTIVGKATLLNDSVVYIDYTITIWKDGAYKHVDYGHAEITFENAKWTTILRKRTITTVETIVR